MYPALLSYWRNILYNITSNEKLMNGGGAVKKTGAVLVAAGLSSRMGDFKPMLPFGDSTIVLHIVTMLKKLEVDPIVIVTGYRAEELEEHLSHVDVRFVKNERYEKTQMFDSIVFGIHAISSECERILIMPADIPAIMPETMRQVLMIDAPIVRTRYHDEAGHPVILYSDIAESLCKYKGNKGMRGAIRESGISITNVEVEDEGVCRDVDTKEEYEELLEWNYQRGEGYPIRPKVQVRLMANKAFFGPGVYELLELVGQTGSLQEACFRMGLSYSKGSRMVKEAERQLGFPLAQRWAGGTGGGGSRLTEEGKNLLENYRQMLTEVQECTEQIYQKYFGKGFRV